MRGFRSGLVMGSNPMGESPLLVKLEVYVFCVFVLFLFFFLKKENGLGLLSCPAMVEEKTREEGGGERQIDRERQI